MSKIEYHGMKEESEGETRRRRSGAVWTTERFRKDERRAKAFHC